eukprot:PITA_06263
MVEEYESIIKKSVLEMVPKPTRKIVVGSKWIFKIKHAIEGSIEKYNAIFVAKGISQFEGIDYEETFTIVARLRRALCCLKQAPQAWYTRINSYLTRLCFTKSEEDANLYHIFVEVKFLIIVLYVDDLILTSDENLTSSCKGDLAREFEMKDMGLKHYFLRLEVWQGDGE